MKALTSNHDEADNTYALGAPTTMIYQTMYYVTSPPMQWGPYFVARKTQQVCTTDTAILKKKVIVHH